MPLVSELIVPFLLGAVTVGSYTWRTMAVMQGDIGVVVVSSALSVVAGFYGTTYIVEDNIIAYGSFGAGSGAVTVFMAWVNKRRTPQKDSKD